MAHIAVAIFGTRGSRGVHELDHSYAEGALSAVGAGEEVVRFDCFPTHPSMCQ
jgi:hypothetical protein